MKTLGIGIVDARYGARLHYANFQKLPPVLVELRAEENHSGSNFVFSRKWKLTGGGSLLRMGSHAVDACLSLKQWEGEYRIGRSIRPVSVLADTADFIHTDASERAKKANAHRWMSSSLCLKVPLDSF